MDDSQDVFNWILAQKADETIEEIDRDSLTEYIGTQDFLAVVFCMTFPFDINNN